MPHNLPSVSIVIPARSAAETLPATLRSAESQSYSGKIEIIVAAADEETARAATGAIVVDNPRGNTAAGLNLAITRSRGEVVVRCDAHAVLPPDYVDKAVAILLATGAANVGGMQVPVGATPWEKAIAAAMTSPFGAGDARYRRGGEAGPAETVYLGVFRRDALEEVGGFDESFVRNQDYELNHRLTSADETVWFDPSLKVTYKPRGSLRALSRQYWDYGKAKRQFARRHQGSLRWRQVLPPLLVVGLVTSLMASIWLPWMLVPVVAYLVTMITAGFPSPRKTAALMTMHMAWGLGFLTGTA